jgi:DNA mismatch endonuclease (patch repair protein)
MAVRRAAHRMGLRFRLHLRDLPGTPDLVFPKWRLALFVHGCFWHRHHGCRRASVPQTNAEVWTAKFERNTRRDMEAVHALEAAGWNTLTIWECEARSEETIRRKLAACLARLDA